MRDCSYGTYVPDITIRCIKENQVIRYYLSSGLNVNTNLTGFDEINQYDVFRINELINSTGSASTSCIENFWQNCLVIIPSQTGNQPRLVWGPHPNTSYNNGFNVYRAIVSPGQPEPAEGNFALLTPNGLSNSTFTYTDGDINLGSNNNSLVYYFVKAKGSGSTLSAKTNTVNIDGRYIEIEKKKGNKEIEINNFSLSQNHPNPFNPVTTIVYQTPTAGIVNLSVYNLLGEKIATFANDYKEAGEYTVQFNASKLPSGTYIYTLTTNRNRISKKLSVMK